MFLRLTLTCVLGLLLVLTPFHIANSQEGTEALGTPVGAFILYPSLTIGTEYNDNIFATPNNEKDDVVFRITPELSIQSDWDNHYLEFRSSATFNQYVNHSDENVIDYEFLSTSRLDILEDTYLLASAGLNHDHEDRTSPDDVDGKEPTEYTIIGGTLSPYHRFNQTWINLENTIQHIEYDNVEAQGGGTIDNSFRDRLETRSQLRVGYDFNPDVGAFLQGHFGVEKYDNSTANRDAYDYGVAVGMNFDVTDLLIGDVYAGYQWRDQQQGDFDDHNSYNIGAGLTWFATELTTVNLNASRGWDETTVAGSSSALTTNTGLVVTHSLLDTVSLSGFFNYTREEFEDTDRTDNTYSFGPEVIYLVNRFVHLSLGYTYSQRDSDESDEDYTENIVLFTTRLQY